MWMYALLVFVPISLAAQSLLHLGPLWVFGTAILAIVPLADGIRRGTEQIADRSGSAVGGLLNVSLGNAAELIIGLIILSSGRVNVVKAQITGSIIGNGLLGLGVAILAGSFGREKQTFDRQKTGLLSSMLILVVIALLVPALFDYTERGYLSVPHPEALEMRLSVGVAIVMLIIYVANLVYTLVTHRDVFAFDSEEEGGSGSISESKSEMWPLWKALTVLLGATVLTAVEAELVSGALEGAAAGLHLTEFFLGVIVLAVVGNAAEYISAIYFARKNRMGLVMAITLGASIQVGLVVAPVLVLASFALGHPMTLVFANPLELVAVAGVAFAVRAIADDGETNWFEGVLLVGIYLILGLAFYYVGS